LRLVADRRFRQLGGWLSSLPIVATISRFGRIRPSSRSRCNLCGHTGRDMPRSWRRCRKPRTHPHRLSASIRMLCGVWIPDHDLRLREATMDWGLPMLTSDFVLRTHDCRLRTRTDDYRLRTHTYVCRLRTCTHVSRLRTRTHVSRLRTRTYGCKALTRSLAGNVSAWLFACAPKNRTVDGRCCANVRHGCADDDRKRRRKQTQPGRGKQRHAKKACSNRERGVDDSLVHAAVSARERREAS
jgi:hypothetical protein